MFATLNTLFKGANARSRENLRDYFAIDLIDQKVREATSSLQIAKTTLANLILRERSEVRQVANLEKRVDELMGRTRKAMQDGRDQMATEGATAIAQMENELAMRVETVERLQTKITRLRQSIETANRRIIDLKQSATSAKAIHSEQKMQTRLRGAGQQNAIDEAEELIARVMGREDPFEQSEVLREINSGLNYGDINERMSDAGYGPTARSTAADVLTRLAVKS